MMDGKVDQDVREAAARWLESTGADMWGVCVDIRNGSADEYPTVQAFARMREAGRQAGLREAAEAADKLEDEYWSRWKSGYDMHDQGISNGASAVSAAITALIEGEGE